VLLIISATLLVFDKSLARRQQWWPKRFPPLMVGAHNAWIGQDQMLNNMAVTQLYFIMTITQSLSTVVCKQINDDNKKCRQIAGIFDTIWMQRYGEQHIAWWNTSWASLEATGCHQRASECSVLELKTEELIYISSYRTFWETKNLWLINLQESSKKRLTHIRATVISD